MGYKSVLHINTQFTGGVANTGSCVITKPTGLAVNQLMLAFFLSAVDAVTAPAGWTQYDTDDSTNMRSVVFYKIATSSDVAATNFTFTAATALGPFCGGISAYDNVDTSNPINAQGLGVLNTTTNPVTTPGATTTQPALLVDYFAVRIASTTISTFTGSGNERADGGNHGASTAYSMAWYDSGTTVAAGSNAGIAITASGSVTQSIARTIAIQAAPLSDGTDTDSLTEGVPRIASSTADTGSGANSQTIAASFNKTDAVSGAEAQSLSTTRTVTDSVTATESQSVFESSATKSSNDAVLFDDTTPSIAFRRSDTGSFGESMGIISVTDWSLPGVGTTTDILLSSFLVMGPATIYVADFGALEPLDTAVTSTPDSLVWTDLGGSLGGVKLILGQEYEPIERPVQTTENVGRRLKKREYTAEAELVEPSIDKFSYLLNGGTSSSGSGWKSYTAPMLDKATPLTYKAVIVDGWAPGFINDRHRRRRVIMRKCLSVGHVVMGFNSDSQTTLSASWVSHRVDGVIAPIKVIEEV